MKSNLHYFKLLAREKKEDIFLPSPHGLLSKEVPHYTIEAANNRVLSNTSRIQQYQAVHKMLVGNE